MKPNYNLELLNLKTWNKTKMEYVDNSGLNLCDIKAVIY